MDQCISVNEAPTTQKNVLLVAPDPICRAGLWVIVQGVANTSIVAHVGEWAHARRVAQEHQLDVVFMDGGDRTVECLELVAQLHIEHPSLAIMVVTRAMDISLGARAMRAGAGGYALRSDDLEVLRYGLCSVMRGETWMSDAVSGDVVDTALGRSERKIDLLSNRELEVFTLLGEGRSSRKIARQLFISQKTVDAHRERIKMKLGVATASELIQQAVVFVHGGSSR